MLHSLSLSLSAPFSLSLSLSLELHLHEAVAVNERLTRQRSHWGDMPRVQPASLPFRGM